RTTGVTRSSGACGSAEPVLGSTRSKDSHVSLAAGQAARVEILQEWKGVLAARPHRFPERGDGEPRRRASGPNDFLRAGEELRTDHDLWRDPHQPTIGADRPDQLLSEPGGDQLPDRGRGGPGAGARGNQPAALP